MFSFLIRSLAGALVSTALVGATSAQSPSTNLAAKSSETFLFKVCNSRTFHAYVAVRFNSDGKNFVTHGWWPIRPRTCQDIADFRKGNFYVFAQSFDTNPIQVFVHGPQLVKICVVDRKNFTYIGTRNCNPSDLRDFSHLRVMKNTVSWNL
jgi:uncharacterized membrane protein